MDDRDKHGHPEIEVDLDPTRIVFIDETAANTKMARLYGRAPRGERCRAPVPHGHWKTTTFTAGLRHDGIAAPMVLDGPMNGDAFLAYVEQALVPELRPGDIVIMDNLPAHKVHGVRQAIEAASASLRYLPPYSPDFNPIEMASSSSRPRCAPPKREPFPTFGKPSPTLCAASPHKNAPTISPLQVTMQRERKML
jgi:transposase